MLEALEKVKIDDARADLDGAADFEGTIEREGVGVGIGSRHCPEMHASPLEHLSNLLPEHGSPWDRVLTQVPK